MESSVLEEKVFHKVMKNVPFGLVVSSEGRKRKVYYVNTMAYHMLGYTREEFIEILAEIDQYEKYCKENPDYQNNRTTHAVANISRVYDDRLIKHDFLKEETP